MAEDNKTVSSTAVKPDLKCSFSFMVRFIMLSVCSPSLAILIKKPFLALLLITRQISGEYLVHNHCQKRFPAIFCKTLPYIVM